MPQVKCVAFCGRIQEQCISGEITSDSNARSLRSLFSTMVLYFGPMKVGEEKSHSRELKRLDDVLGCFYSLSMRASFSSFTVPVLLICSFNSRTLRRDCRRVSEVGRDHWRSPCWHLNHLYQEVVTSNFQIT